MIDVNTLRPGVTFELDGQVYIVISFLHVKPGKGSAFVRTKIRNIETGNVIYKSITCLQKRPAAGVVMGGACPIVVPSRSDDYKTKLYSIQFARLLIG